MDFAVTWWLLALHTHFQSPSQLFFLPTLLFIIQDPDLGGAWPAFCPALPDGSPTISPRTNDPTITPSASPIENLPKVPTISPTGGKPSPASDKPQWSSLIPGPTPSKKPSHPVFGKSSKSKTHKPPSSSKSGKSKSGKKGKPKSSKGGNPWSSGQGYLNANIVYEDLKVNSSSMLSSYYGLSLVTFFVTFYVSGGL